MERGPNHDDGAEFVPPKAEEVYLNPPERIRLIKGLVEEIVAIAGNGELSDEQKHEVMNRHIEEIILHANAQPSLLNVRNQTLITFLQYREETTPKVTALLCTQLLGSFTERTKRPVQWEMNPPAVKRAFVSELHDVMHAYIVEQSFTRLMKVEEIISGFIVTYPRDHDREIQNLCHSLDSVIRHHLHNEDSNLEIQMKTYLTLVIAILRTLASKIM